LPASNLVTQHSGKLPERVLPGAIDVIAALPEHAPQRPTHVSRRARHGVNKWFKDLGGFLVGERHVFGHASAAIAVEPRV
jgi:hypothetical protein